MNIDRVGNASVSQCVVTSVRDPAAVDRWIRVLNGKDKDDWDLVPVVVSRSIMVSPNCTR